jgi:DNA processing protein
MTAPLTDECYARAALTYLAEPADRWLGPLIAAHGAQTTLDAIKLGRPLPLPDVPGAPTALIPGTGTPHNATRRAMYRAIQRWRVRLPELPTREQVADFAATGIRLICPGDPEWPGQLADLGHDQPYALWLRGNADLRFSCLRSVAIVGSRAATGYGSYVATEFAASAAARGWAVVSGGAYGIDAAAHRGALSADGVTIAVLACGVNVPYPAGHTDLFDAIAAQGVIASEWPPDRTVTRLRFLVRNRVIAALATGTLVVEAGQRSGALNTARHARDLDRCLMAVPGPITSEASAGCHQVIREWQGILVTSVAQVIDQVSMVTGPLLAGPSHETALPDHPGQVGRSGQTAQPARPVQPTVPAPPVLARDQLDLESAQVLDAMPARAGLTTGRIAQRAGVSPATALRCLGELASGGFIERCEEGWRLRRTPRPVAG